MTGDEKNQADLTAAYAQKFWDAGNLVVTATFALAFGVYALLAASHSLRCLAALNFLTLFLLSVVGNLGLGLVLVRLTVHERRLSKLITENFIFDDALRSALDIRVAMLVFNTILYVGVLWLIKENVDLKKCDVTRDSPSIVSPK